MTTKTAENTLISAFRARLSDLRGLVSELDAVLSDNPEALPPMLQARGLVDCDRIIADFARIVESLAHDFDPMAGRLADK